MGLGLGLGLGFQRACPPSYPDGSYFIDNACANAYYTDDAKANKYVTRN